jgi:hypothetical protein
MSTRSIFTIAVLAIALVGSSLPIQAQTESAGGQAPAVTYNTWTSGAPMPTALVGSAAAVLQGQIYVVGGFNDSAIVADTQVFNPATNVWSTGVPLPTPVTDAAAAVVNNVLYVIGGTDSLGGSPATNTVWAYNPKTKTWSPKAAMPTARESAPAVVVNNIIYVIGGWDGVFSGNGLASVESYNPATDKWTEENPLLVGKWAPSAGPFGTKVTGYTIVAPDGAAQCCPSDFTGDNESYNVSTNAWASLNPDPTARGFACFGSIGSKLYVAGGNDTQGPALIFTESYQLSKNAWKTLASIPQATIAPGSAVYKGRLYCFGGWTAWNGGVLDSVQIYQPPLTTTTTTLTSAPNPSTYGQAVTFAAGITSSDGAPPDGETVTFVEGKAVLGTGTLSGGSASFTTSTLNVGTNSITAVYAGDSNFAASTSKAVSQVVSKATTTNTLNSSENPSHFGQSVTFTATVAPQFSGTPTGTVTFLNGATTLGTATLSEGKGAFTTSTLAVGVHSITAEYNGSSDYKTSTSSALSQTVNKAGSSVELVSSVNPSAFNEAVKFTATVTPATSGTATGTVTFKNGTAALGTATLSEGKGAFTTSTLAVEVHFITAEYNGSADYNASTSSALSQTVRKAGTSVKLVSSVNPSAFNEAVKFTATITPATSGTATGTVTFKNGTAALGTATLSAEKAVLTTSTLAVGVHSITAEYNGSADYNASTSSALSQTVRKAGTSVKLVSSVNPSAFNEAVKFTAMVAPATSGTATGTVTFKNGTAALGTATLSAGKAAFTTSTLAVGVHSITAEYNGSVDFGGSTSAVLTHTVNKAATSSSVVSSPNPSTVGQTVMFTATVKAATSGAPTGTVTFKDGTTTLSAVSLAAGKGTFQTSKLAKGTHAITAAYEGNANYLVSKSPTLTQTVK